MLNGLFTSATAMDAFSTSLDNTSNNLANINTTAFKRSTVNFADLVYQGDLGNQIGSGTRVASITPTGITDGVINKTGRDQDVAINGNGFLVVQSPDGNFHYTRDGALTRDANGMLVTSSGNTVQPPIQIPMDTLSMSIATDGTVSVLTSSAPGVTKVLGQIQLANFVNPEGLSIMPGNLYDESIASGPPAIGSPGTDGLGSIQQYALEMSNVDVSTELASMVTTQQAFAANSKVVGTTNQMLQSAMSLIQ